MIRLKIFWILFFISTMGLSQKSFHPEELVNPLMGTDSKYSLSNGNTYPAIARPWGMNFWMPQTGNMGDGWAYQYSANKILGFKQTHQPSPWINDYGQFSILPISNKISFTENERASWFSHKAEIAKPYLYNVYLADYNIDVSITATERSSVFKIQYAQSDSSGIIIDAFDKGSFVKYFPEENKVIGYTTKNSGGVPSNFKNYFVIYFSKKIEFFKLWNSKEYITKVYEINTNHAGIFVGFKTKNKEKIEIKISSSFISFEQAEINLKREVGNKNFEAVLKESKNIWNKELSKIKVEGGNNDQEKTFYSCLYRVLLFPRKFYEFDVNNKIVHYSPYNGEVLFGYMFTDNGFWDTFRAVFPFFNLMYPSLVSQIMQGLENTYKESGWLPEWASPGHRDCMIGSNSASIISDAYLKGVRNFDIDLLYEALIKNSNYEGPLSSVGRKGIDFYNKLGYIPYDKGINENVARTLEYAFADFNLYRLSKSLNKPKIDVERFKKQMMNYRNVFDTEHKLMRGKNADGIFQNPFNPFKWGDAFTEGNSWHYSWSVFQDIEGLKKVMGGDAYFIGMLDSVFTMPPIFDESYYGQTIHEIREMQIINMGQYAHGNQPIQHMPYLYNYTSQPWKSQWHVRNIMDKLYKPTPDGYCGDEDNGQTSAWYVFSAMGFYPVTPGSNQYVIGSPLFKKISLQLESGKQIKFEVENNNAENIYIQNITFNHKSYSNNFLQHFDLIKGCTINFRMSKIPNKRRGIRTTNFPYSYSLKKK